MLKSNKNYGVRSMFVLIILTSYFLLLTSATALAQSVDILWQGETYTHPFYKGRSLWSTESSIKLVAVPQGIPGNPANFIYKWTKNGTVQGHISGGGANGVGKNTFTFKDPLISRPQTILVEIVSANGETLASGRVFLTPSAPSLAIYEYSPLYGFLFNKEMGAEETLRGQEVTFTAFPMFFTAISRTDSALKYEWRTNAGQPEQKNSVTYRAPAEASGTSRISVGAVHDRLITQSASKDFLVKFGND